MTAARESRPGGTQAAEAFSGAALSLDELDALAEHVRGAFVVVVEHATEDDQRYLRRTYLSANSAEKAARRAQSRGQRVRVFLAELRPVYRIGFDA